ncbi:MAG: DUF559 domain-containing protein [Saprospiraceae bacterium]|nr:DUF559 domain-containing protein [Saprospiraceae bacterium]
MHYGLGYKVLRFSNDEVLYRWEEVEKKVMAFYRSPRTLAVVCGSFIKL